MLPADLPAWIEAEGFIGIPFTDRRADKTGADCWGLYNLAHERAFGYRLPDYDGPQWQGRKLSDPGVIGAAAAAFAARFKAIPQGDEVFGDCALWRMRGHPLHVGFVVKPGWMLHIEEGCDSVVESYRVQRFHGRLVNFYRHDPA